MANRFVSSTGSNTSPYDTWAKAATTFATGIAGTSSGDVIAVDVTNPPADVSANTVWTFVSDCSVIASTNSGTSTITPTTMGTSAYLGAGGASSYALTLAGAFKVYFYGITLRIPGSSGVNMTMASTDGCHFEFENCYFWLGATNASARIVVGSGSAGVNSYAKFSSCTFRFGNVSHLMLCSGEVEFFGGNVSSDGSTPNTLLGTQGNMQNVSFNGADLSLITGTLVASQPGAPVVFKFTQCKIGSGVTPMATQTPANKSSAKVWLFDCSSGDTHGLFGYHDAFGSVVSNQSIYVASGAAAQSWQIDTTANCSYSTPFVTPWVSFYNTGTSGITPRFEILRDGSTTAYTDAEVWGEFSAKVTSGSTQATFYNDRQALADWAAGTTASNQAAGAGLGSWTGESGTAWSGKVDSGSTITPAENGHIRGRVVVGVASSTVYVNPQIET